MEADPLDGGKKERLKRLENPKKIFYEKTGLDTFVKSKRKGVLPPGEQQKLVQ